MWFVYILYSASCNKTYTGFTNDVQRRLDEHNFSNKAAYTTRCRPWILMHVEVFNLKQEAAQREKLLKTGQGREEKKRILDNFLSTN